MLPATAGPRIDPSNAEAAKAWDGEEGGYWAAHATRFDESVAVYNQPLLDAAGLQPGDRVLDIGCGTGQTTRDAARIATAGSVLGVDLSAAMIDLARRLAADEDLHNARFEQVDAQIHPFPTGGCDVVVSRTGAMFFGDPVAAFTNIARALRPGGRLALLVWRSFERNEWIRELMAAMAAGRDLPAPPPDAPGPFSLADPDRVTGILTAAGFAQIVFSGLSGPMYWGPDTEDAYHLALGLLGWMLEGLDADRRRSATDALRTTLARHTGADGVTYDSATWIITARKA